MLNRRNISRLDVVDYIIYLFFCPLTALLTHLFSIFNPKWQQKSLLLKTAEGFLCAGPQLVLQLALWMRGTLTSPLHLVLAQKDGLVRTHLT